MADQNTVPIPQGATIGDAASAAPATTTPAAVPIPQGATIGETTPPPAPERGAVENVLGGIMQGASKSVQGVGNLIGEGVEKLTGMPAGSLQAGRTETEAPSTARNVGEGAENVGEFMMGDELLKYGLTGCGAGFQISRIG